MLALAEWIAPDFSIDGFWTYVGATIVVWLVNVVVGAAARAQSQASCDQARARSLGPRARRGRLRRRRLSPTATCTAATVAANGAVTGCSIFIASSVTSGCRGATSSPGDDVYRDHRSGHRRGDAAAAAGSSLLRGRLEVGWRSGWRRREVEAPGSAPTRRSPSAAAAAESGGCSTRKAVDTVAGAERGVRDEPAQEREIGHEPGDLGLRECPRQLVERLVTRCAAGDELRDHRVVARPDLVARLDAGVDPHAARAGRAARCDRSAGGT